MSSTIVRNEMQGCIEGVYYARACEINNVAISFETLSLILVITVALHEGVWVTRTKQKQQVDKSLVGLGPI